MAKTITACVCVLLFFCGQTYSEQRPKLRNGNYEDLTIALNAKTISGFYESEGGDSGGEHGGIPKWTCTFYFSGIHAGTKPSRIVARRIWRDSTGRQRTDVFTGHVAPVFANGQDAAIVSFPEQPPGCFFGPPLVGSLAIAHVFEAPEKWLEIRMVSSKRARFYESSRALKPTRRYVTAGDIVFVYKKDNGRAYSEFRSFPRVTAGWLLESDLVPTE